MGEHFAKIACPPEKRTVRACGEGRRPGARATSLSQPFEPTGRRNDRDTRSPFPRRPREAGYWRVGKRLNQTRQIIATKELAGELAQVCAQVCLTESKPGRIE